jgi:hypothetical protein
MSDYDVLKADADAYKQTLTDQVYSIQKTFNDATNNNQKVTTGIVTPQVVTVTKQNYTLVFILGAIMLYLYSEGKLKL